MLSSHDWMRRKRIHENLEQVQHTMRKHLSCRIVCGHYSSRNIRSIVFSLFLLLFFFFFFVDFLGKSGNSGGKIHLWPNFSLDGEYIPIYVWKIKISRCIIRSTMKKGEMLFLVPVIFPNGTFFVVQHPTTDCVFLFMPVVFLFFFLFFSPRRGNRYKNK